MPEEVPLAALWERATAGDGAAFTAFYQRHGDAVFGHCLARTGSRTDAEDLALEVFTITWQRRAAVHFSADGDILPSLFATANFLLKRHHASTARRSLLLHRVGPQDFSPDPADEVIGNAVSRELLQRARAAVDQLRPDDRELIQLSVIGGLPTAQLAVMLGANPGAIRTRLSRALARARKEYWKMSKTRADIDGTAAVKT